MWTYAHQGQHALCYWCQTYVCDSCVIGLHTECVGEPCQCGEGACGGDDDDA